MSELILKPGPVLIWREWKSDGTEKTGGWVESDVTALSHEYLFETVTIEDGLLLADIFRLLCASPALSLILRRNFSEELLTEAGKGILPTFILGYSPEGIEYLELSQIWNFNTATREYEALYRLDLHGIGYALRKDSDLGEGCIYPAGTRIIWNISTIAVRELLAVPIRLNQAVSIFENDLSAKKYAHELEKVEVQGFSLSQVLHGVLWGLSCHGEPVKQPSFVHESKSWIENIKRRCRPPPNINTCIKDDVLGKLDESGFAALFEDLGGLSKKEIFFTLQDLENNEPVQIGLIARLSNDIVIKSQFAMMEARAFRTLFREAQKIDPAA